MRALSRVPAGPTTPEMSTSEFHALRTWIRERTGIEIVPAKRPLLVARLAPRLRMLGLVTFGAYFEHAKRHAVEIQHLIDRVTTNETSFFREHLHFRLIETRCIPAWRTQAAAGARSRRVRVWSAASATGEEAYSLAMVLLRHLPEREGWTHEVVASDISSRALERAREATWPSEVASEIPREYLKAFMLRGVGVNEGLVRASAELRRVVRVEQVNLNDATYSVGGAFDVIFCRNVLIYFSEPVRARVVERLIQRLRPDGLLFLGHAETLHRITDRAVAVAPHVYGLGGLATQKEVSSAASR